MASLPTIYTIQASDAPQHTDRLREILQEMETENRIKGFTTLGIDDDLSSVPDTLKKDDMILILLTNELEEKREQFKKRVSSLKSDQPGLRVAEILVENLIYDNDYITFPGDLRPIRNREDMDEAWKNIARILRDMFPVKKKKKAKPFPQWILFVLLGVFLFGALLIFILPSASGEETEETFTTVPDLAGMSGTEAVSLLLDAGLEAGEHKVESHDIVNRDLVIRSEPNAGDSIEIGTQVNLILSGGRVLIPVPDLRGMTLREASSVLEKFELRIGQQQSEHSDQIEQGRVIRSDPLTGREVDRGSQINLVTSLGPSTFDVFLKGAGANKIAVIKEVRGITGLGLKESKELVDNAPNPIKKGVGKEEAEKLKAQLEEAGAEVDIFYYSEEQSEFDVILKGAGAKKIAVIKEVRGITGLGLKESKELVDNAPNPIKKGVGKEEAEKLKAQLEEAGAEVDIFYSASPTPSVDASFRLVVEDMFTVAGRGTVLTGRIQTGTIFTGDRVHILSSDEREVKQTTLIISGIEEGRGLVDVARAGAEVGLLLRGINREDVETGDVVIGIP